MSEPIEKYLHNCLYFTANSLARRITAMAEEAFGKVGLSPSHAFLVMLVNEQPGISQKELSRALNLAPSTVTRFVDSLQLRQGLVERRSEGKAARIFPTERGAAMAEPIAACWHDLFVRYSAVLGEEQGRELTRATDLAGELLAGSKQAD